MMEWYVVHTKPRQEFRAQENLLNQGFETYLPTNDMQKLLGQSLGINQEPLFARYLFIHLDQVQSNWYPIRSTRGVHQVLRFGLNTDPVKVPHEVIQLIKDQLCEIGKSPKNMFELNDPVVIKDGSMKGLNGSFQEIYRQPNGEHRALVLIDFLGKLQKIKVPVNSISKVVN